VVVMLVCGALSGGPAVGITGAARVDFVTTDGRVLCRRGAAAPALVGPSP